MTFEQRVYSQRICDYTKEILRIFEDGGVDYVTARMILRDVEDEMFQNHHNFYTGNTPKPLEKKKFMSQTEESERKESA